MPRNGRTASAVSTAKLRQKWRIFVGHGFSRAANRHLPSEASAPEVHKATTFSAASMLLLCLSAALLLSSCGYHVAGTTSEALPGIHVIEVPAFANRTNRYNLEQPLTEAVIHEFLASTRYHVVSTDKSADAVLHGEILSLESTALLYDTQTDTATNTTIARATTMLVTVKFSVELEDESTKKILYQNKNYVFRQPYEISTDPTTFFDEQGPALDRMYRDFASRLVADIVDKF